MLKFRSAINAERISQQFERNYRYSVDVSTLSKKMTERRPWIRCSGFFKALEERDEKAVNTLLDSGFDIDTYIMYRKTAISFCVSNEWYDMAELLVKRGCSLSLKSESGETPLHMAVFKSNYELVKLLLRYRADVTSIDLLNKTALHYACQMNNLRIVTLLLEHITPVSLNFKDKDMRTPLFYACQYGCKDMISALIEKGAKVNMADSLGNTPLLHSIVNPTCSPDLVKVLLDAEADVNHINKFNETALSTAMRMCPNKPVLLAVCLYLIDNGCDIDAKTDYGETPLDIAVSLKEETLVRKLLNNGCGVKRALVTDLGRLCYACTNGYDKIASLLFDAGEYYAIMSRQNIASLMERAQKSNANNKVAVIKMMEEISKFPTLRTLCRTAIRQNLPKSIEKSALLLPLPPFLIRYLQLY